ncbi:MAG: glycoside hydrolase family 38 C-terminal domain-containing protein, partial [Candidatus Gallimonas sp.]
ILKKCHTDFMLTIKISWNKYNKFPYHTFRWEGIDGTEILVHMPPSGTYNDSLQPKAILQAYEADGEKAESGAGLILYGIGDGGGGPGRDHLERLCRVRSLQCLPPVQSRTTQEFFEELDQNRNAYPHYCGELYLEKHQATYTSQARNKRFNCMAERDLHTMDVFCAAAYLAGAPDDKETRDRIWKEVLLYQFHDILPGSAIARVYRETDERYPVLLAEIAKLTQKAIDVASETGPFNPVCVERRELAADETTVMCFNGYGKVSRTEKLGAAPHAEVGRLENAFLIAEFDGNGHLSALIRKADGRNYIADASDRFVLYEDGGDAWDFGEGYLQKESVGEFETVDAKWFLQGGYAVAEFLRKYGSSTITHRVKLSAVKEYLEFETEADWQERGTLLRAEFFPAEWCDTVNCGIQFGNFVRSTREDTAVERAQEEICAQRYIDMSNAEGGLAVLAENKFGYRVKDGKILMSLLRGSEYPGEDADRGRQIFRYALYPHTGDFAHSETAARAYEFRYPVLDRAPRGLPVWKADGVQLEAVKIAENGDGIVFRFYETHGLVGHLECADKNVRLREISIDEEEEYGEAENKIAFAPYEIKTLKMDIKGRI